MNIHEILSILRGEREINPNLGIEEDDLLENAFFDLPKTEKDSFWPMFVDALRLLAVNKEGMPVYLASRFIYSLSEIKPRQLPHKKNLFDFLLIVLDADSPDPMRAGVLLLLLVLDRGNAEFWKKQVAASLIRLEENQDTTYGMAAVVYAFLGLNPKDTIMAEDWGRLFLVLSELPRTPRLELLELLVGVEKETKEPERLREELETGLNELASSTKRNILPELKPSIKSVFKTWLERNDPHPAIAMLLDNQLSDRQHSKKWEFSSPRQVLKDIYDARYEHRKATV
ncbi:MAG: hypothetical protein Q8M09_06450 [Pseudomonadota bacterium]|nr:hypothetical protein [Pseudomonadota bacterium]MDP1903869.1 hypothetical protein [Pseudomonadota bacterium]MDP2353633.1 hypothetical protein [Pseudomonadota bacterium]